MKTLAIDYGEKRIGLAISDELGIIASPMPTLKVKSLADAVSKIHGIALSQGVEFIVIGLARGRQREETQQSIQTRYFATALEATNGIKVDFWDETFSTQQAEQSLSKGSKRKKQNLDSEAARIILQGYLDYQKEKQKISGYIPQYSNNLLFK